jgi:hypothetical protein
MIFLSLVFKSTTSQRNLKWGFHYILTNDIYAIWQHCDQFHIITINISAILENIFWKFFPNNGLTLIDFNKSSTGCFNYIFTFREDIVWVHWFTNPATYRTKKSIGLWSSWLLHCVVLWMCLHLIRALSSVITWKPLTSYPLWYFSLKTLHTLQNCRCSKADILHITNTINYMYIFHDISFLVYLMMLSVSGLYSADLYGRKWMTDWTAFVRKRS